MVSKVIKTLDPSGMEVTLLDNGINIVVTGAHVDLIKCLEGLLKYLEGLDARIIDYTSTPMAKPNPLTPQQPTIFFYVVIIAEMRKRKTIEQN